MKQKPLAELVKEQLEKNSDISEMTRQLLVLAYEHLTEDTEFKTGK